MNLRAERIRRSRLLKWQVGCPIRDAAARAGFTGGPAVLERPHPLGCFTTIYWRMRPIASLCMTMGYEHEAKEVSSVMSEYQTFGAEGGRVTTPSWVRHAVFYQIFPDRFARSMHVSKPGGLEPWDSDPTTYGYKGGDLLGVVEHLDELQDLGITALYFNPIFQSASNHRYHTHDYYQVDPLLGGNPAFEVMLRACHDRGMRVVLDGVFNHASRGFFPFNDVLENGEGSPYRDWFRIRHYPFNAYDHNQPPGYESWVGLHALPNLNTDNPEVREYIMRVGEH